MRLVPAIFLSFICGAALTGSGIAATMMGPKGNFSSMGWKLEYDPGTACSKPYRPFKDDEYSWRLYRTEVESYLSCMKSAATADMTYAQEVVADGYRKAVDDFRREIELGY